LIEIEYIVKDKHGMERLRTADKKAADAYDKALEIADRLAQLLREHQVLPNLPEPDLEELTIYLARNARTRRSTAVQRPPCLSERHQDGHAGPTDGWMTRSTLTGGIHRQGGQAHDRVAGHEHQTNLRGRIIDGRLHTLMVALSQRAGRARYLDGDHR